MSNLIKLKEYTNHPDTKQRMQDLLDNNAPAFLSSIVSAVSNNNALQKCDPGSIMSSAFVAAALKLPIDPNLGFSYIIPYKDKAQFQIGWKGFVQLAMRSGQYRSIHVAEVYKDELAIYNPIIGEAKFTESENWKDRYSGKYEPIGYFARFELLNGFIKEDYKSRQEVELHAKKYSQTYKKGYGVWKDDFDSMAKKTVLKLLLSKYGILSTELQTAIIKDQTSDDYYADNPNNEPAPEVQDGKGNIVDDVLGDM